MQMSDAQYKWEILALNAIEQAARTNWMLAHAIQETISAGQPINPNQLLAIIRENQLRLGRDIRGLRDITDQRRKEQP